MRVCFALLYYDPAFDDLTAFLDHTVILRHLPQALMERGHDVEAVLLFRRDGLVCLDGVTYRAYADPARWAAVAVGRLLDRPSPHFEVPGKAIRYLAGSGADIIHFHGTHVHLNHALLRRKLRRNGPPVVVHYHGGFRPRHPAVRAIHRRNMASAVRVLVTEASQADRLDGVRVVRELVETSTPFSLRNRDEARAETGMHGHPVYVSAGRLHPIKDPLTTLRAFERILAIQPDAHLYHYYSSDELLDELKNYVDTRPALHGHVHFCGRVPQPKMEAVYNSADFLLQASRREFSGCAVLEAMACGAIPIITDIPPFRRITGDGRAGVLFPPGNPTAMASAALRVGVDEIPTERARVSGYFKEHLSFPAMAEKLEEIYAEVLAER